MVMSALIQVKRPVCPRIHNRVRPPTLYSPIPARTHSQCRGIPAQQSILWFFAGKVRRRLRLCPPTRLPTPWVRPMGIVYWLTMARTRLLTQPVCRRGRRNGFWCIHIPERVQPQTTTRIRHKEMRSHLPVSRALVRPIRYLAMCWQRP